MTSNTKIKIKNITKLLVGAYEKKQDEELYKLWALQFPNMDKESYISLEDYKNKLRVQNHTKISYEDIDIEMEKVIRSFETKGVEKK